MSKIKDKFIGIYDVKVKRDRAGNEVKVKRYIHGQKRLHAYVRELSDTEKFAAKATGVEQSIVFIVNYNKKIKAGQFIEFRDDTYCIVSLDSFEFYRRDLTLRAVGINSETYEHEEFD